MRRVDFIQECNLLWQGTRNAFILLALFLTISLSAMAATPTLSGYTSSANLNAYRLTAQEAYDLLEEWQQIMSLNLDDLPSARETEIYRLLMLSEDAAGTITPKNERWSQSMGNIERMAMIDFVQDVAWLEPALYRADKVLTLRNPTTFCPAADGYVDTWLESDGELSVLDTGVFALPVVNAASWILDHPELFNQDCPAHPDISLTLPGTTYLERAKFYLLEMKKTYDICESVGMNWVFDASDGGHAWVWTGNKPMIDALKQVQTNNPNGVLHAQLRNVWTATGQNLPGYNRIFAYICAYKTLAEGLQKLDQIEGTTNYTTYASNAFTFTEQCMRSFRKWRVDHQDPLPLGDSFTFPYRPSSPPNNMEDIIHLEMDVLFLEGLRASNLLTTDDIAGFAGILTSRFFDPELHVCYRLISRDYLYDNTTGEINSYLWFRNPIRLAWVGQGGTPEQMQMAATISMDVFSQQMLEMSESSDRTNTLLGRKDTRRTRNVMGPFEIYNLKMERAKRTFTPTPGGNRAPSFTATPSYTVQEGTPAGEAIGTLTATDPDSGQSVYYWITGGNRDNSFKIDPNTGELRTTRLKEFTLTGGTTVSLKVTAMDTGYPMELTTITVPIAITAPSISNLALAAWWKLDEADLSGQARDSSGNGHHATYHASMTDDDVVVGKMGFALEMDGADDIVSAPFFQDEPAFSIMFWLNPDTLVNFNQRIQANSGWDYFLFSSTDTGALYVGIDVATRFTPSELPSDTLQTNVWQHFTFTYDQGNAALYKDGTLLASKSGMTAPLAWSSFKMGSGAGYIDGKIDDVRIYHQALSQAQINALLAPPNGYLSWAASKGLTSTNDAWGADADNDGHINFIEYAFGGEPLTKDNPALPTLSFTGNTLEYDFSQLRSGLSGSVYLRDTLQAGSWKPSTDPAYSNAINLLNGKASIDPALLQQDHIFIRFEVTE